MRFSFFTFVVSFREETSCPEILGESVREASSSRKEVVAEQTLNEK